MKLYLFNISLEFLVRNSHFTSLIKQILKLDRTGRKLKDVSVIIGKQIVKTFPWLILQKDDNFS